jgi:hypothetical protein
MVASPQAPWESVPMFARGEDTSSPGGFTVWIGYRHIRYIHKGIQYTTPPHVQMSASHLERSTKLSGS